MPAPAGFLGRSLDALRAALRIALGIGQGSCLLPGVPANSLRGRIVVLNEAIAGTLNTFLAVILTEHLYSAERRYQVILPILHAPVGPSRPYELIIGWRSWHTVLSSPVQAAVFPIPATLSLWHSAAIARETEYVLDEATLAEVDRVLCAYFSLPLAEPDERR